MAIKIESRISHTTNLGILQFEWAKIQNISYEEVKVMIDISLGAVGAAMIAAIVSMLGLIIGKEQKISDFRQAWIEDLRKCLIAYLVNINAIADMLLLMKSGEQVDTKDLVTNYKLLNEANHGISFRINSNEKPAKILLNAMAEFEKLAKENSTITSENIKEAEEKFKKASKRLLKFEWNRVKKGERTYVVTKFITGFSVVITISLFTYATIIHYSSDIAAGKNADRGQPPKSTRIR